jgi:hypothetical protein
MERKGSSLIRGRSDRRSDGRGADSSACIDEISRLLKPLAIFYENPASLSPAPRNARQHSRRQVSQLCASISEFGTKEGVRICAIGLTGRRLHTLVRADDGQ